MKTQIIALEAHDDFISVRDRMSWAKSPRILLVWPKFEKITLRPADLRILQQHASYLGAELGIITRRGEVRRDAERFGIPVFGSAAAAQRQIWAPRERLNQPSTKRKPRKRAELEALRNAAASMEAPWKSRPVARVGFFALGVLAVLVIAGLFVPEATVTLTPMSSKESVTLPVTASESISAVSITGSVPAHTITVTVSGSQAARVTTQSTIPDHKAQGIARFTNLTQSDLTVPKGTVIYGLSPTAVQFATLNETHIPGNVDAVIEVPIEAAKGGADANLPANALQAIQGNLGLSAAVTNPDATHGGTDRMTAAPSEADRGRLHDVVVGLLEKQAEEQVRSSIGANDVLLFPSLKMAQILEEAYDPPPGEPGNLLKLTLQAEFKAKYLAAADLQRLARAAIYSGSRPKGSLLVPGSKEYEVVSTPRVDDAGIAHFDLKVNWDKVSIVMPRVANELARGRTPQQASHALQAALPLSGMPEIKLSPAWWPWMPLIPFRVTVVVNR